MIKGFTPRLYQQTIFASAAKFNTLVVLPTGMGKTNVFLLLAAQRLKQYPDSKILLLGPTRPLIDQYYAVFQKHFEISEDKMAIFTGHVSPEKRQELWKTCQVFFSTPQGLENDIISNRINLEEVSLLGIDEAHRAVGDYAYVFVSKQYMKKAKRPRILGLTASPGSDLEKINEVVKNLHIEEIEVRTEDDPDVKEYIQEVDVHWLKVKLPPTFLEIKKHFDTFIKNKLQKLKSSGILQRKNLLVSKKDLLGMQGAIRARIAQGEKDYTLWNAISVLAEIMKVHHALELLETQGIASLQSYLEKLEKQAYSSSTKAVKNLVKDVDFRSALLKAKTLFEEGAEHPKLVELQHFVESEVKKNPDMKTIIFNQYRDNASDIVEKLNTIKGVEARLFIGQTKKKDQGMTQKQQKAMLDEFRDSLFNVLVATSVGEEGLDIPKVDLVIFFEPVSSAIRHIQRKGRTGRLEKGRVVILMAEGTRDVGYKWSAHHKEKRMHRNLKSLRQKLKTTLSTKKEPTLDQFITNEKIKIYVDHREKNSPVVKALLDLGVDIGLEQMENADYLLSNRTGVEFKTVEDFVDSILDGRLMDQVKRMKNAFGRPLLIIEGTHDLYAVRNVHANAIRGMLSNIAISFGIPILQTKSPQETAALLHIIAKREQDETTKDFMPHSLKRVSDTKWLQEYIISSLPGIGATLAKPLLEHFGSIKNIVNASVEDLQEVEKIGKKKAEEIRRILDEGY